MRASLALLPFCLCATPAFAQPAAPEAVPTPQLADPATADRLADTVQSLSDALLDVKIGGMQAALEGRKATPGERNRTVRDLARRDDPDIDRHLDERIAQAKPAIEQSIRAVNEALPEIARSLAEARKSLERAMANMPDPNYPRR
jgi:hypothetical protein